MKKGILFLMVVTILFVCSCNSTEGDGKTGSSGSLKIIIANDNSRSALSSSEDVNFSDITSYAAKGIGPDNARFSALEIKDQIIQDLVPGSWYVFVAGHSSDEKIIANGDGTVIITEGTLNILEVTLKPFTEPETAE